MQSRAPLSDATRTVQLRLVAGADLQDAVFDTARRFDVAPAAIWRALTAPEGTRQSPGSTVAPVRSAYAA
jgi:hypothetical protein